MCDVFEIPTFYGIFLFHDTMKQAMWEASHFALKLALNWEIW
jgi:hypothetical protein